MKMCRCQAALVRLLLGIAFIFVVWTPTQRMAVHCLRISSIEVPPAVMNSSQLVLACNYHLDGDQLYSVKWYKNYVEFYRFQPADSSTLNQANSTFASASNSDNQALSSNTKQDFELDGISLNLAKSNATHVHLRQVSLASEGTYKCEVSADSPSFATVSMERQMKVYVLPKQKLSILDNFLTQAQPSSAVSNLNQSSGESPTAHSRLQPTATLNYNVNEVINLTCISGPSRPKAILSWLINDLAVQNSTGWLSAPTFLAHNAANNDGHQLYESKLTLAFRLQPQHLSGNGPLEPLAAGQLLKPSSFSRHHQLESPLNKFQVLKLRCIAKLEVEFTSETSILVSSGQTNLKRRQNQSRQKLHTEPSRLPAPSLLQANLSRPAPDYPARDTQTRPGLGTGDSSADHLSVYRWPRPAQSSGQVSSSTRQRTMQPEAFVDPWITSPMTTSSSSSVDSSLDSTDLANLGADSSPARYNQRQSTVASSRSANVWTSRQLRMQAEFIGAKLQLSRANEIEPPLIDAKIKPDYEPDNYSKSTTDGGDNSDPMSGEEAAFNLSSSSPGDLLAAEHRWDESDSSGEINGDEQDAGRQSVATGQDYELNDRVEFVCSSRVGQHSGEQLKSVQLMWLINDRLISVPQLNFFDGSKFYYTNQLDPHHRSSRTEPTNAKLLTWPPSFDPSNSRLEISDNQNATTSSPLTLTTIATHNQQSQRGDRLPLLIEFTSSLFQLKELNLKCRTRVEQPLIEFETQVIASIPTSQLSANQQDQQSSNSRHRSSPSSILRNQNHRSNGRLFANNANQQQRNRNSGSSTRQQSSSSSSSSSPSAFAIHRNSVATSQFATICLIVILFF